MRHFQHIRALASVLRAATACGLVAATACPATATDIPQRGVSSLSRLQTADGLAVERAAQLRMQGTGLRFVETAEDTSQGAPYPTLSLASGDCTVRLEDRNRDGHYETLHVRKAGRMASRCDRADTPLRMAVVEAGENVPALDNCRLLTLSDHSVSCQPTRFGRDNGEAWTVLSGFADRHLRQATGRPGDLSWDTGLLVLDDISGVIYRVVDAPFVPSTTPEEAPETPVQPTRGLPKPPQLVTTSQLDNLPVSHERQKVLDDQEETYAKYRPSESEDGTVSVTGE